MMKTYGWALATTMRAWRLVVLLWAINLALGVVAVAPAFARLVSALRHSAPAHRLTDWVESSVLVDVVGLFVDRPEVVGSFLVSVILAALLHVLTVGGVLGRIDAARYGDRSQTTLAGFLADSGRFAWRSIRLSAWALPVTALALMLIRVANKGIDLYADGTLYETPVLRLKFASMLFTVVLLTFVRAVVDAARASMFLGDGSSMRRALRDGLVQVVRHPGSALIAYGLVGATLLGLALGVAYLRLWIPQAGWAGTFAAIAVGQLAVALRLAGMVATSAAALEARSHAGQKRYR